MKKLLIALFSVLLMAGCASKNATMLGYEMDPVATANALWKEGDVIIQTSITLGDNVAREVRRVFLGVTTKGHYVVQEFYNNTDIQATS